MRGATLVLLLLFAVGAFADDGAIQSITPGGGGAADTLDGIDSTAFCQNAGGSLCPLTASTTTFAASTALDFAATSLTTVTLTGNVVFTTSGLAAGRTLTLRIVGDGSIRTLGFPAWKFVGSTAPATIAASKVAVLSLVSFGTTDADVVAAYSVEP